MKPEVQGHEGDDRDDREHDTDQCGEKIQSDPCENDNRAGVVGDIIIVHNTPPLLAPDVQEQVVGDRVEHEYRMHQYIIMPSSRILWYQFHLDCSSPYHGWLCQQAAWCADF